MLLFLLLFVSFFSLDSSNQFFFGGYVFDFFSFLLKSIFSVPVGLIKLTIGKESYDIMTMSPKPSRF